jgi:predicted ABC-type ATPase
VEAKNLYIIAGCNGAGKTTASFTILPEIIECKEFVNADEIARGLSPFQPESMSIEAGRIMISRVDQLLNEGQTFAFETTLSSKTYQHKIIEAKKNDYTVTLLFFWLQSVDLAIERVRMRVLEGGHNIDKDIISRRYVNGLRNLFNIYLPIVDGALLFDNSDGKYELIAKKSINGSLHTFNEEKLLKMKSL